MSNEDDKKERIPKLVSWNENRSLCEAYRDKRAPYGNLSKEERLAQEQKEDKAAAKRLAQKSLSLRRGGKRAKDRNPSEPDFSRLAYRPEGTRLRLSKDLSLHQIDLDIGWELPDRDRGSISVYCDLRHQTSELFLSDAFQYRHGRPYDLKTDTDFQSKVRNTLRDLSLLPPDFRDLVHSLRATCVCKCIDCRKNPNCECALLAKLLNKGLVCLKNNKFYIDNEVTDLNHEELTCLGMGCGQGCLCYQHKSCDKNVDLLHFNMPKLEIFRKDKIVNFGVRTLESLQPGDVVCEFTGKLETAEMVQECRGADAYSFQIVFDQNLDYLTQTFIDEIEKNAEYQQFGDIYNHLREHANDLEEKTITAHISPLANGNVAQFVSHGCLPNLEVIRVMANHALPQFHRLFLIAARHIEAGEELFISYGINYVKHRIKKCLCGLPLCFNGPHKNYLNSVSIQKLEQFLSSIFLPKCREQAERTDEYLKKLISGGILSKPANTEDLPIDDVLYEDVEMVDAQKQYNDSISELKRIRLEDMQEDFAKYEETRMYAESVSTHNKTVDYFSSVKVKREPSDIIEVYQQPITLDDHFGIHDPSALLPKIKIEPEEQFGEEVQSSEKSPVVERRKRMINKSHTNPRLSPKKNGLSRRTAPRKRSIRKRIVTSSSSSSEHSPPPTEQIPIEQSSKKVEESRLTALDHQKELYSQLGIKSISLEVKSFKIPMKKRQKIPHEGIVEPISSTDQSTSGSMSVSSRDQFSISSKKKLNTTEYVPTWRHPNQHTSALTERWRRKKDSYNINKQWRHTKSASNFTRRNAVQVDQYQVAPKPPSAATRPPLRPTINFTNRDAIINSQSIRYVKSRERPPW